MKKLLFVFSIVLLFAACDTGNMNNTGNTGNETGNPFIGTWETNEDAPKLPKKMIFTDNEVTGYADNGDIFSFVGYMPYPMPNVTVTWTGTYEYNDTQIIMRLNPDTNMTVAYEFKNNILHFGGCPYNKK